MRRKGPAPRCIPSLSFKTVSNVTYKNVMGSLVGSWHQTRERTNLGGRMVYYLPPRVILEDVRIDVLSPFQPIVHQHRS